MTIATGHDDVWVPVDGVRIRMGWPPCATLNEVRGEFIRSPEGKKLSTFAQQALLVLIELSSDEIPEVSAAFVVRFTSILSGAPDFDPEVKRAIREIVDAGLVDWIAHSSSGVCRHLMLRPHPAIRINRPHPYHRIRKELVL